MLRAYFFSLFVALAVLVAVPIEAHADDNVDARAYFDHGNDLLNQALRTRGTRREELLREALAAYVHSMGIVRSRNAVFNAAQVLEELGRLDEAFTHYTEYQRMQGVAPDDIAAAGRRIDALRPRIAVVALATAPAGAEVYVDRRDLAPRGTTPLEIALPAGEHTLTFALRGYDEATRTVNAAIGERTTLDATLTVQPVTMRIAAVSGRATVDGNEVAIGRDFQLPPGPHVVRLTNEGAPPQEQTIELEAGGPARVVQFDAAVPATARTGTLIIESTAESRVLAGGVLLGQGRNVTHEVPAGAHQLLVEAYGYRPLSMRVDVPAGQQVRVHAQMEPDVDPGTTLGSLPLVFGVGTAIAGAVAIGLSVRAVSLNEDFEDLTADPSSTRAAQIDAADDVDDANTIADVMWGATAIFGATAIALAIADEPYEARPSSAVLVAAPLPEGAMLIARGEIP